MSLLEAQARENVRRASEQQADDMTHADRTFAEDFQYSIVANLYRDSYLLNRVGPALDPVLFSDVMNGAYLKQAVEWITVWWEKYKSPPTRETFRQLWWSSVQQSPPPRQDHDTKAWQYLEYQVFDNPAHDANREFVSEKCVQWLAERQELLLTIEAHKHVADGKPLEEFDLVGRVQDIEQMQTSFEVGMTLGLSDVESELTQAVKNVPRAVLSTGRAKFDEICGGGPAKRELWAFAAPPNTGKTTNLCSLAADYVAQGYNVAYFTLEDGMKAIYDMIFQSVVGASMSQMRDNPHAHAVMKQWIEYIHGAGGSLAVQEFPTGQMTVRDVYRTIHALESKFGIKYDVVLIDYADNMKLSGEYKDLRHNLRQTYVDLRGMAMELDILVWTATQTNRSSTSKKDDQFVRIEDLTECFEKAAVVDGLISINQDDAMHEQGIYKLFWAKNRHGSKWVYVTCTVDYGVTRVIEQQNTVGFDFGGQAQATYGTLVAQTPAEDGPPTPGIVDPYANLVSGVQQAPLPEAMPVAGVTLHTPAGALSGAPPTMPDAMPTYADPDVARYEHQLEHQAGGPPPGTAAALQEAEIAVASGQQPQPGQPLPTTSMAQMMAGVAARPVTVGAT